MSGSQKTGGPHKTGGSEIGRAQKVGGVGRAQKSMTDETQKTSEAHYLVRKNCSYNIITMVKLLT